MKTKSLLIAIVGCFLGLGLSVIFVSTSFGASPETMLIGKWKGREGKTTIEFVKDGVLIINNEGARYRIIDKERVELDMGQMLFPIFSGVGPRPIFKFTVSDDELILTPLTKPNETEKFRRVKVDASGNDPDTYLNSAENNMKQGNYQQAIKDLDRAIELDPKYALAYAARGFGYGLLGNYQQAIKDSDRAIELDPKYVPAYLSRGMAYALLGNYQQAIKDSDKAIELNPRNAPAYFSRGVGYMSLGNHQQGIKDLDRAIELDPKYEMAYVKRGLGYELLGNYQQAINNYNKAIELNPRNAEFCNQLAWLLATVKVATFRNGEKAVELALRACQLWDWKEPAALGTLAAAYARVGDFDNAVKWQEKALESPKYTNYKTEALQRLNLYRQRKAWPPD